MWKLSRIATRSPGNTRRGRTDMFKATGGRTLRLTSARWATTAGSADEYRVPTKGTSAEDDLGTSSIDSESLTGFPRGCLE